MAGELYRLASGTTEGSFVITKYDHIGFEVLSNYHMSDAITCECPAGHRDTCRHRQMVPQMLDLIDTDLFHRYEDGRRFKFEDGKLVEVGQPKVPMPFGYKPPRADVIHTDGTMIEYKLSRPAPPVEGETVAPPEPFRRRI